MMVQAEQQFIYFHEVWNEIYFARKLMLNTLVWVAKTITINTVTSF